MIRRPPRSTPIRFRRQRQMCIRDRVYLEFKTIDDFANKKPKEVFEEYQAWCEDEGLEPLSKSSLDSNVKTKYNLEIGSVRLEEKNPFDKTVSKTTKRAYKPKKE